MAASKERIREVVDEYVRLVATGTAEEIHASTGLPFTFRHARATMPPSHEPLGDEMSVSGCAL